MFSRCFCQPSRKLLAVLLAVFSLLLSAVLEAFRQPSWKLFDVFAGRLGSFSLFFDGHLKLLAVFDGRLGSFLLFSSAVLEASRCFSLPFLLYCDQPFSCCFSQPLLLFFWLFFSLF